MTSREWHMVASAMADLGCRWVIAAALAATGLIGAAAAAQQSPQPKGPPNAMQGFSTNRDKPVRIQAATLEVRDKDKVATFTGDVHVTQGDTDMRCKVLVVFYEGDATQPGTPAAQPGPGGQGQIKRMEAKGNVVVTQKDQVATGDRADYDVRSNTIILTGNVVVTRGQDVLRGNRLIVDLTSGVSNVESGGGRVEMLIQPSQRPTADANAAQPQQPLQLQPAQSPQAQPARPARKN
jgi:lipopolysaccharide export system protein LptA